MIMSAVSSSPTRRSFLASSAAAGAFALLSRFLVVLFAATVSLAPPATVLAQQPAQTGAQAQGSAEANAVRPFRINVPEAALVDLRRRVAATRWPDRETVTDQSQGVQLAKIQELVRYWGTDYDWRKAEAKLNALPQFVTEIDGLDLRAPGGHFAAWEQPELFAAEIRAAFRSLR
jgi:Epoxide hydrolase N terminus